MRQGDNERMEAAARHAEATVSWDALRGEGMSMDELMQPEPEEMDPCETCGIDHEAEEGAVRRETMDRLMVYLFSDGRPEAWELVARRAYALAKFFFPHLLMMRGPEGEPKAMTLERLGHVFDEPNTEAARARWQVRIDKMVTDLLTANGSHAKAGYQKNSQARARMSQAQMGNRNRCGNADADARRAGARTQQGG